MAVSDEKSQKNLSLEETIEIVEKLGDRERPSLGIIDGFITKLFFVTWYGDSLLYPGKTIRLSVYGRVFLRPKKIIRLKLYKKVLLFSSPFSSVDVMSLHLGCIEFHPVIRLEHIRNLVKGLEESGEKYPATWLPQYRDFDLNIQKGETTVFKTKYYIYPYIECIPSDELADAVEIPYERGMQLACWKYMTVTKSANKK